MVIDLAACDGCGKCTDACTQSHFVPSDREFIRIFKMRDSSTTAPYWFPRPCFHCDDPPCTRVCPVGATFKRQDGIVLIDADRCIGCRFCMAACPFSARVFNWSRPNNPPAAKARGYSPEWGYPRRVGTAEKCDFCADMAREGKLPHCVRQCSMGAMWFGDENEDAVTNSTGQTVRLSTLLRDRAGYRFMEDLGTKPRVYYLPPDNRTSPAPGEPGNAGESHHAKGADH
jgi:molybdopterin-containing oxidoreductase family iron-sulfur binding subunit